MAFGPRAFLKREDPSAVASVDAPKADAAETQKRYVPTASQFLPFYPGMFYGMPAQQKRFDYAYGPAAKFEYEG